MISLGNAVSAAKGQWTVYNVPGILSVIISLVPLRGIAAKMGVRVSAASLVHLVEGYAMILSYYVGMQVDLNKW